MAISTSHMSAWKKRPISERPISLLSLFLSTHDQWVAWALAPARSRVPCIRTTSVAEWSHADGYRKKINKVSLNKLVSGFAAPPQKTTYSSILSIPEVAVLGPGCLLNSYASIRYTQYAVQRGSARCKAQRGSAQDQSRTSRFCRCIPGCVTSCCCCFKQEPHR